MQAIAMKEMQGMLQAGPNPMAMQAAYQRMAKKMEELSKDTGDKLLDLLAAEQKGKGKEMTGKPFKGAKP